jgi:hypothetical protein
MDEPPLNCKLLFLPRELVRYVLIHELCHTLVHNHSSRFWAMVPVRSSRSMALSSDDLVEVRSVEPQHLGRIPLVPGPIGRPFNVERPCDEGQALVEVLLDPEAGDLFQEIVEGHIDRLGCR